jgi:hypothetical protein
MEEKRWGTIKQRCSVITALDEKYWLKSLLAINKPLACRKHCYGIRQWNLLIMDVNIFFVLNFASSKEQERRLIFAEKIPIAIAL